MRTAAAVSVLALAAHGALAKLNTFKMLLASKDDPVVPVNYFELPIDHFNSNAGTFKNRWWFNDTFYSPGGPVIIQDVGEEDAEPFTTFLTEPNGVQTAVMQLAQKYKGIGVVWEHRYFGGSVPFVQDGTVADVDSLNGDQWSYHTFEQALEDVVFFANNFSLPADASATSKLKSPDALHASKTPFLFLGGSYPGVRASTLRIRNPETIFASWASSAPVQASIDMSSYYRAVARGLPSNCSSDFAAAMKFFDSSVSGSDATLESTVKSEVVSAATGQQFSTASTDKLDDANVGEFMIGMYGGFQTGGPEAMAFYCNILETAGGKVSPSAQGLASQVSADQVFEAALMVVSQDAKSRQAGTSALETQILAPDFSALAPASTTAKTQTQIDGVSWMWLFCSEFGYFQIADSKASSNIITSFETIDRVQARCNKAFPGMLPSAPQADAINKKYGGWTQNPSRVMYTNGELDPWRTLSVASIEDGAPKRSPTTTVPSADAAPDSSSYYGTVYQGQVHAVDFFSSTGQSDARNQAFKTGLSMFSAALDQWMGSFKQGSDPVLTTATGTVTGTSAKPDSTGTDGSGKSDGKKSGAVSVGASTGVLAMAAIVLALS